MTSILNIDQGNVAGVAIAPIAPGDLPDVVGMLGELAIYEEAREPVCSTAESLHTTMFNVHPSLFGFIARRGDEPAGMILGYETYSTFAMLPRLFIEDLFVRSQYRGGGIGRALIAAFARRCEARGYDSVQWRVRDRNAPAICFYGSIGAVVSTEYRNCSLTGDALCKLARSGGAKAPPALRFAAGHGRSFNRSL